LNENLRQKSLVDHGLLKENPATRGVPFNHQKSTINNFR